MEPLVRLERDERCRAAAERDDAGIDARRGVERDARQPSRNDDLVRRAPDDALHAARPRQSQLVATPHSTTRSARTRRLAGSSNSLCRIARRLVERQVRDHREVFARERDREHVGLEHADVRPAAVQLRRPATVLLDREHAAGRFATALPSGARCRRRCRRRDRASRRPPRVRVAPLAAGREESADCQQADGRHCGADLPRMTRTIAIGRDANTGRVSRLRPGPPAPR